MRYLIPWYGVMVQPFQDLKTNLLVAGREKGKIKDSNPGKRQTYTTSIMFILNDD